MIPLDLAQQKRRMQRRVMSPFIEAGRAVIGMDESYEASQLLEGLSCFIKPPNLNDISDISEDFDHLFGGTWVIKENIFQRSPKTVGFFDRWRWRMFRGEFPSDAKEMGDGNITWKRGSKVVGKNHPHLFFWSWSGSWNIFLGNLGKKLKNVVLNLLDFMDEMRVEETWCERFHDITSIV